MVQTLGPTINIDHDTLLEIIGERIEDGRLLRLIKYLLKAGYMEEWKYNHTHSGTPQGGIISPLLANIYLDELDKWVENDLMPRYNRRINKVGRRRNPTWRSYKGKKYYAKKKGDRQAYKKYDKLMKTVPSVMTEDEGYRKLDYIRYADDFLLSFAGPRHEAEEIKEEIREFLRGRLKLELSKEKTLITHARTEKARFLGYELSIMHSIDRRTVNGGIRFGVPREAITRTMKRYCKKGKPSNRPELLVVSDYEIILTYQQALAGLVQYYQMAHNVAKLSVVRWAMQVSLLKTLANKHKSTTTKIAKKYRSERTVNGKKYKVIEAKVERKDKEPLISHFGAVPLSRNPKPDTIHDLKYKEYPARNELVKRMLAEECEMCEATGYVEVHHIRGLKDLYKNGRRKKSAWVIRMATRRRKTLVVCRPCHNAIEHGKHRPEWDALNDVLESRVQ